MTIEEALCFVHRPPPDVSTSLLENGIHPAQQRLAFEELLAHHLSLRSLRKKVIKFKAVSLKSSGRLIEKFLGSLPFNLTAAQKKVIQEIKSDLELTHPMSRLLQGDVGSGKTIVAAVALLQSIEAGYQAALMVPTELLSEQHFFNLNQWFTALGINVVNLTGKLSAKIRQQYLSDIESGTAQLVIGTHALFQKEVKFSKLGLIVVDEQHRFGVNQRLALRAKGSVQNQIPHQLMMTATPIPRTLALILYADMDHSIIDELPPGRKPVKTVVFSNQRRDEVIQRIRQACQEGRQIYWVCPLIEESEVLQCQAAEQTFKQLSTQLKEFKIGLLHGQMKAQDKEIVMNDFKENKIQILVATTVIEVGVDVPNATLMIIENAERMGLSQLHQLRGRVGRGSTESFCLLMYQSPLSAFAKERLETLRTTHDGFEIAKKDLELRGQGELLGTRQAGDLRFRVANLLRDQKLLPTIQKAANCLLKDYPDHVSRLINRWISQSEEYKTI